MNGEPLPTDHDRLVRLETIISVDHENLKKRVTNLEMWQSWLAGIGTILIILSAALGVVVGHFLK